MAITNDQLFSYKSSESGNIPSSRASYFNLNRSFINNSKNRGHKLKLNFELSNKLDQLFINTRSKALNSGKKSKHKCANSKSEIKKYDFKNWKITETIIDKAYFERSNHGSDDFSFSSTPSFSSSNIKHRNNNLSTPISILYYKYFFYQKLIHREKFIPLYESNSTYFTKATNYSSILKYLNLKQCECFKTAGSSSFNQVDDFCNDEKNFIKAEGQVVNRN